MVHLQASCCPNYGLRARLERVTSRLPLVAREIAGPVGCVWTWTSGGSRFERSESELNVFESNALQKPAIKVDLWSAGVSDRSRAGCHPTSFLPRASRHPAWPPPFGTPTTTLSRKTRTKLAWNSDDSIGIRDSNRSQNFCPSRAHRPLSPTSAASLLDLAARFFNTPLPSKLHFPLVRLILHSLRTAMECKRFALQFRARTQRLENAKATSG